MRSIITTGLAAVPMSASGSGSGGGGTPPKATPADEGDKKLAAARAEADKAKAEAAEANKRIAELEAQVNQSRKNADTARNDSAFKIDVLSAIAKLKHTENGDWQEDGRPSLKRIIAIAGNNKITQADVDAAAPDLRRETVKADSDKASAAAIRKDEDDEAPEELDGVRVRATAKGQYGGKVRQPGEEFTYSGPKAKWFIVLKKA